MFGYHFVGDRLRDGRPVPPDGEWLVHDCPVELCFSGLHASRRPWHALRYATGETLCLVELDCVVEEETDKLVARRRRIVRRVDLTADLWAFARECARDVLHLWDAPDIVRRYLVTGDEALRDAARVADEHRVATDAATEAAAWAAVKAASREGAAAAAWSAARSAAVATAWAASREDQGARAAARAAAWDALGARFDALCRRRLEAEG